MDAIINFIISDILQQPPVVLSIVGLIGLLLLKKPTEAVVTSVVKIFVGMTAFSIGLDGMMATMEDASLLLLRGMNIPAESAGFGGVPIAVSSDTLWSAASIVLLLALLVNIIIARFTRFKFIYLTAHWSLQIGLGVIAALMHWGGMSFWPAILVAALLMGTYQSIAPWVAQPFVYKLTGTKDIALGHASSIGVAFCGWIGEVFGERGENKSSWEDLKLPKRLSFLKEIVVAVALTMMIFFAVMTFVGGWDFVRENLSAGQNPLLFSIFVGLRFSAGMMVLLYGIRLFISEIVPAFKGITDKLVPGATPALDSPVFFQFAPVSLVVGYVVAQTTSFISIWLLFLANWHIPVIMLTSENLFGGGLAAGVGNAVGGRRGAVISAGLFGFIITFIRALAWHMPGAAMDFAQAFFSWDPTFMMALPGTIITLLGLNTFDTVATGPIPAWVHFALAGVLVVLIAFAIFARAVWAKRPENIIPETVEEKA